MLHLTVSAMIGWIANTVAINALHGSDRLNNFVNWISSARVNRDILTQSVWWKAKLAIAKTGPAAGENQDQARGYYQVTLLPLLKTFLISGDKEEIRQTISTLVMVDCASMVYGTTGETRARLVDILASGATKLATELVDDHLGENIAEKVLATMVQKHGWEPLRIRLEKAIGPRFGRDFTIRQIKTALHFAVINKAEMNQADSLAYCTLADIAHAALKNASPNDMVAHVSRYAPESCDAISRAILKVRGA